MTRKHWLLIIIMIAVAGCGSSEPCAVQSKDYFYEVDGLQDKFLDAARDPSLDAYETVDEFEAIYEEAKDLKPPSCARKAHDHLITWYELVIEGSKVEATGDTTVGLEVIEAADEALHQFSIERINVTNDFAFEE